MPASDEEKIRTKPQATTALRTSRYTAHSLLVEMRNDSFAEKPGLLRTLVAPQFQHDVRAACLRDILRYAQCTASASPQSGKLYPAPNPSPREPQLCGHPVPWRPRSAEFLQSSARHSSSVSADPRMFCTLLARYIAAISRAPSRAVFGSSPMLPTITDAEIER